MKTNIATLTQMHVTDSKSHINGNVAEHLINEARSMDNGYFFYLTEAEIEEFENDNHRAAELVAEVEEWINDNYDYETFALSHEFKGTDRLYILWNGNTTPSDKYIDEYVAEISEGFEAMEMDKMVAQAYGYDNCQIFGYTKVEKAWNKLDFELPSLTWTKETGYILEKPSIEELTNLAKLLKVKAENSTEIEVALQAFLNE